MKLSRQQREIVNAFRKNGYKLTTRDFMQPQKCKACGHWEESLGIVNFSQRFTELKNEYGFKIESKQLEPGLWEYEMTHDPERPAVATLPFIGGEWNVPIKHTHV